MHSQVLEMEVVGHEDAWLWVNKIYPFHLMFLLRNENYVARILVYLRWSFLDFLCFMFKLILKYRFHVLFFDIRIGVANLFCNSHWRKYSCNCEPNFLIRDRLVILTQNYFSLLMEPLLSKLRIQFFLPCGKTLKIYSCLWLCSRMLFSGVGDSLYYS